MRLLLAARLSRKQANGQEGMGIETQDELGRLWAERNEHDVIAVAAGTAKGTLPPWDRKYLKPWVTKPELMAGYDGILAFKTDRLSRGDQEDFTRIEAWATENGKCLVIAGGDGIMYPARNDSDYWQWAATKREARKEWESIRERGMREQRALMEQGKLVGKPPWGLSSAGPKYDRRIVLTADGKRYIPGVFEHIAAGDTLPAVAKLLSEQTGRTWHPRTVASLIRNRAYAGEYLMGGGKYVHTCPALVDGDLWRRANTNLNARPSPRRGQRNDLTGAGAALLSGLVYCGNPACDATGKDSPMYKVGPPERLVYRCWGRGAQRRGCGASVPLAGADALMNKIMSGLLRPVLRPEFHPATGHQVELDDVAAKLEDLPRRKLPRAEEQAERERLWARQDELEGLPATPAWIERVPVLKANGEPLSHGERWQASTPAGKRTWLRDAAFSVQLTTPGRLADSYDGDRGDGVLSTVDVFESDDAALVFRWSSDADAGLGRELTDRPAR